MNKFGFRISDSLGFFEIMIWTYHDLQWHHMHFCFTWANHTFVNYYWDWIWICIWKYFIYQFIISTNDDLKRFEFSILNIFGNFEIMIWTYHDLMWHHTHFCFIWANHTFASYFWDFWILLYEISSSWGETTDDLNILWFEHIMIWTCHDLEYQDSLSFHHY